MSDRKEAKARAAKAHAEWCESAETAAATEKALADNARLCMGEPSGAEFPPSRELQVLYAKRFRREFFSVVDKYNADQAALDDAEWEKRENEKRSMMHYGSA